MGIEDLIKKPPVSLPADAKCIEAAEAMRQLGVRRIPVVDENGGLDGLVSMDDLLVAISGQLGSLAVVIANEIESES